jgi:hypothetical protein
LTPFSRKIKAGPKTTLTKFSEVDIDAKCWSSSAYSQVKESFLLGSEPGIFLFPFIFNKSISTNQANQAFYAPVTKMYIFGKPSEFTNSQVQYNRFLIFEVFLLTHLSQFLVQLSR